MNSDLTRVPPSSWPMKAECPSFKTAPPSKAARRGNKADGLLRNWISDGVEPPSDELYDSLKWAKDALETTAMGEEIITKKTNCKFPFNYDNRVLVAGEVDVVIPAKNYIADFKTGSKRNYKLPMIAYAKGFMEKMQTDFVKVDILYIDFREKVEYEFHKENVDSIVAVFLERFLKSRGLTKKCSYCSWCLYNGTCESFRKK